MIYPLPLPPPAQIVKDRQLGAPRPTKNPIRRHTGIDLSAPANTPVVAPEEGKVVRLMGWKGNTASLWLAGASGLWLFGALSPLGRAPKGATLLPGQTLGYVGTYPGGTEQLHLELWAPSVSTAKRPIWPLDSNSPPAALRDPWAALTGAEVASSNTATGTDDFAIGAVLLFAAAVAAAVATRRA